MVSFFRNSNSPPSKIQSSILHSALYAFLHAESINFSNSSSNHSGFSDLMMLIISAPKLPWMSSSFDVASTTLEIPLNMFFSLLKLIIMRNCENRETCSMKRENRRTDFVYILSSDERVPSKYFERYLIRSLIAGISTTVRNSSSNPNIRMRRA